MPRIPLTRIAAFSPFPEYLVKNGCNVARHLSAFGIAPESLASEESLVPLRLACEFIEQVSRSEGIDRIGLEVGSGVSILEVGLFGKVLSQSLTLNDLIQKFIRWIPFVDSGVRVWMEPSDKDPGSVRLCMRHEIDIGRAQVDAYGLLILIDAVRLAAGPEWKPKRASLDRGLGDVSGYEALSEAAITRTTNHVAVEFHTDSLGLPVARNGLAASLPDEVLKVASPSEDLIESVCQTIEAGFGIRMPMINDVAEMAAISVSTLQRRLGKEGITFQDLLDRVRFQRASALLEAESPHVSDIAWFLGYSNPANFTHAFRRWTGTSPSHYRMTKIRGECSSRTSPTP